MIPGVLDLREKVVSVVNCTKEPITLHAKQLIGTCESDTDSEQSGSVHVRKVSQSILRNQLVHNSQNIYMTYFQNVQCF